MQDKTCTMKTLMTILLFTLMALASCKKDSDQSAGTVEQGITYPDSVFYGKNILVFPDSTVLTDGAVYGMGAALQKDANLVLVITNLSPVDSVTGHQPGWFHGETIGWLAGNYNTANQSQKFTAVQKGKIDMQMNFLSFGFHGLCKIDFYENSTAITRTKYLKWQ